MNSFDGGAYTGKYETPFYRGCRVCIPACLCATGMGTLAGIVVTVCPSVVTGSLVKIACRVGCAEGAIIGCILDRNISHSEAEGKKMVVTTQPESVMKEEKKMK